MTDLPHSPAHIGQDDKPCTASALPVRAMLNAVPHPMAYKDAKGCYRACNTAFLAFSGLDEAEVLGKYATDIFLPEAALRFAMQDAETLASGRVHVSEEVVTFATGKNVRLEITRTPCPDPHGGPGGLIFLGRHLPLHPQSEPPKLGTDSKPAKKDGTQEVSQIHNDFLSNISHEIRTPMNGILGLCFLAQGKTCPPDVADYLQKIENSAKRLMSVLNDMMDFSLLTAGKLEKEVAEFSPHVLATQVLAQLRPDAQQKGLDIYCEIAPDMPERLWGDATRLQQILLNLGNNAVKFTREGGVILSFSALHQQGNVLTVELTVADTGIGMRQELLPSLFEPFSQADTSASRQFSGSGLGLSLCKGCAELLGGSIVGTSVPGMGSLFSVTLPLEVSTLREAPAVEEADEMDILRGARVLLVEDNMINQLITREILEDKGASVDVAEHGLEALRMVARWQYDIILMDIQMPQMDGITCTLRLREDPGMDHVPIIALSARTLEEEQALSLAAGMQSHVNKPVDPVSLCSTVARWVRSKRDPTR